MLKIVDRLSRLAGQFRGFQRPTEASLKPTNAQQAFDARMLDGPVEMAGVCPVCGDKSWFEGFSDNVRESGTCSTCQSFNRQRQMAHAIRTRFKVGSTGPFRFPSGFVIYNTETTGALHHRLSATDGYLCSEYFGDEFLPGQDVGGRRHEDLRALSFPSDSIDLVMSSDVMEHMPDPYAAHREILRVLKPGGTHIFTVPFVATMATDQIRAKLVDGEIQYLEEKAFHGDPVRPDEGVLVWTIFGLEMFARLEALGFETAARNLFFPDEGIVGAWSLIFEARKSR
ncbi:class I SAM-dependent methyltransferase [Variovorax sp. RTB1]|uniref:class I SAM-dependent methyltransferase n=1 Tax=Variovorax sp. RTB1 TaxID=3048631 RepID=UPI002B238B6E|nr:class I SAM-dependent methyltransferase [Variovorax sp. RTB1]MEB0110450.1 class I SAM-dependent methyltransferase [Variovorax sp. RTB1]